MLKSARPSDPHAREACSPGEPVRSSLLPKMSRDQFRGRCHAPQHNQQKSPLSANNLARERITATHAFLRNVTVKTPQSCPKRDARNIDVDHARPTLADRFPAVTCGRPPSGLPNPFVNHSLASRNHTFTAVLRPIPASAPGSLIV